MKKAKILVRLIPTYCCILAVFVLISIVGSDIASFALETEKIEHNHCIIVDAGHGNPDGGATSHSGVLECHINLEISRRLNDLLHLLGFATVMTRDAEESVCSEGSTIAAKKISDLKNRVSMINNTPGGILVSIHQNYYGDSRYSGAQVFYAKTEGSRPLAAVLQKSLKNYLDKDNKRQEKPADTVYLMKKIDCPGVLIECGFLSNPKEDNLLQSAQYQKNICCVIATAISSYLTSERALA